jgi:hypothetical protein
MINDVVRVGDTVRRAPRPGGGFVHGLLRLFEERAWPGAPRFLGTDERGREVLSFLAGQVPWESGPPVAVTTDRALARLAELVREFHDLTAGTPLAGTEEVVCHNDLAPKNTVYRDAGGDLVPAAFIDWDLAAPGARLHDIAHVCWQYLDLGPSVTDLARAGRAMRLICDAYGLTGRDGLVETVLWWQDSCRRGIEAGAAGGDPAMRRLVEAGAARSVAASHAWVARHRRELERRLARR